MGKERRKRGRIRDCVGSNSGGGMLDFLVGRDRGGGHGGALVEGGEEGHVA